ncbi:MAG: short-chain dehydrogenase/reductase [Alphaproteobacteria bacterium]|nr:short-chain dehydrogenase/reductase [Alphaproteobacteria bacterium]
MDFKLEGKTVAITGASEGIGRAIALQLAALGCNLRLASRTEANLDAVREMIRGSANVSVEIYPLDLSKSENQQAFAKACVEDADILVNNAGAIPGGRIDEIDEATWRAAWDLKVFGYINITREFYAAMKARGRGVILNIIGTGGEKPVAEYIAGAAGNASLMAFTRALGGSSPADGIRVLAINPGPVATDRLIGLFKKSARDKLGDEDRYEELFAPLAFGRAAMPEEVASMAAFLVSDLSSYTSGTVVTLDGGQVNKGQLF